MPKRHLEDPSLLVGILGVDVASALTDGNSFGRVLESFVAMDLRAEAAVSKHRPRLHHLRAEQGRHEIDQLVLMGAGRVIAVDVAAADSAENARHLAWLRDRLAAEKSDRERLVAGGALHTGPRTIPLGDRLVAAPICAPWADE